MNVEVKVEVTSAVESFREYGLLATTGVQEALQKAAVLVEREAKLSFKGRDDESVRGEPPRVQTGRLRASITHRLVSDPMGNTEAEIGTNVEYARDVEEGTSRTWPHPFLFPALEKNRDKIYESIGRAVKAAANA